MNSSKAEKKSVRGFKVLMLFLSMPLIVQSMDRVEAIAAPAPAANLETILWIVNATPNNYLLYSSDVKIADIPRARDTKINISSQWAKKDPGANQSIYLSIVKDDLKKLRLVFNVWIRRPEIHGLGVTLFGDVGVLKSEVLHYEPVQGTPGFQIRLVLKGRNLENSYFDLSGSQR